MSSDFIFVFSIVNIFTLLKRILSSCRKSYTQLYGVVNSKRSRRVKPAHSIYSWNDWEGSSAQSFETLFHSLLPPLTRFIFKLNEVKETRLKFFTIQLPSLALGLSVTVWNGKFSFCLRRCVPSTRVKSRWGERKSSFKWFSNRLNTKSTIKLIFKYSFCAHPRPNRYILFRVCHSSWQIKLLLEDIIRSFHSNFDSKYASLRHLMLIYLCIFISRCATESTLGWSNIIEKTFWQCDLMPECRRWHMEIHHHHRIWQFIFHIFPIHLLFRAKVFWMFDEKWPQMASQFELSWHGWMSFLAAKKTQHKSLASSRLQQSHAQIEFY